MSKIVGPEGAFDRLAQVLEASQESENEFRHDLGPVREAGRELIARVGDLTVADATIPAYLYKAADALATVVRDQPGDASAIEDALKDLRTGVATALSLEKPRQPGVDQLEEIERRSRVAALAAEVAAAEIARLLDGAQRLVGQYADDQLATHYRSKAQEEQDSADRWRRWTIIGFTGTLGLSLLTTILAVVANRGFEDLVSTGGLSVALGGLTAYLASQAKLHRDRETAYTEAELKLAVIAPMIDSIDAAAKDSVRSEVVRLLFETQSRTKQPGRRSGFG